MMSKRQTAGPRAADNLNEQLVHCVVIYHCTFQSENAQRLSLCQFMSLAGIFIHSALRKGVVNIEVNNVMRKWG